MTDLRPFQRAFLAKATAPGIETACLSLPRGNGKSFLAARLLTDVLTPDHAMFRAGTESVIVAGSLEQARIVFRYVRQALEPSGEFRFLDSNTRIAITHNATNTKARVIGSNGKTAMGLVGCPWVISDEPGAWEINAGQLVHDAIQTAQGKPGSPLRAVYIGTLAPFGVEGHWWHSMIAEGSRGSTHVQAIQGDPEKWDQWGEIRRCNPLVEISADFRRKLLEERDEAQRDTRLKARFLSYRLNVPTGDESEILLTVDDWKRVEAREVAPRDGLPVVGVDLGAGRAWSAAVALWPTGRTEAVAIAPGIPELAQQEKRDRVPTSVYRRLADQGILRIAEGLRVQPPSMLWDAICELWGGAAVIVCDRFRLHELHDVTGGFVHIQPRIARWSDATADIRALRKLAGDGPLSVDHGSRLLLAASLMAARVKTDDAGNVRMVKKGTNNSARDDVAAAWVLAAGEVHRRHTAPVSQTEFYRPEQPDFDQPNYLYG